MINPQKWKYWKMTTIIPFIFVNIFLFYFPNSIILCSHVLTVLMTYWMTLMEEILAKNFSICACSILYFLILNSFFLATTEEYFLN